MQEGSRRRELTAARCFGLERGCKRGGGESRLLPGVLRLCPHLYSWLCPGRHADRLAARQRELVEISVMSIPCQRFLCWGRACPCVNKCSRKAPPLPGGRLSFA